MQAYVTYAGAGDIHPSQAALADRAAIGKRTVEAVQDWLIEQGWLVVTAPAVKGVRGPTVRLTVPPGKDVATAATATSKETTTTKEEPRLSKSKIQRVTDPPRGFVMVHRAGSYDPNDFVPVPIAEGALAYIEAAQRVRDELTAEQLSPTRGRRVSPIGEQTITT
jgi:hypothetical protein